MTTICSIDGCDGRVECRGWCKRHYRRWQRHGNPHTIIQQHDGAPRRWLEAHIAYEHNDCLIWPFGRSTRGYAIFQTKAYKGNAHRLMCKLAHGDPPTKKHVAAHSCGNGHLGCVNPKHLRWATHAENVADSVRHGTIYEGERHHRAKLSLAHVSEIRRLAGRITRRDLAAKYGVSKTTVDRIISRKIWKRAPVAAIDKALEEMET